MSKFPCRYSNCDKTFADRSNRRRHEQNKSFPEHEGEVVSGKRAPSKTSVPIFDEQNSVWRCPRPDCHVSSGKKSNVQRHINSNCFTKKQHLIKSQKNKICPHCKIEFTQKSNRDRHVLNIHQSDSTAFVDASISEENKRDYVAGVSDNSETTNVSAMDDANISTLPTMWTYQENLNVSFVSENGEMLDLSIIDTETPIFEVSTIETMPEPPEKMAEENPSILGFSPIKCTSELNNRERQSECISLTSLDEPAEDGDIGESSRINLIDELKSLGQRKRTYEAMFTERLSNKIFGNLRSYKKNRAAHSEAIKDIQELFPDLIDDKAFIAWLANKVGIKPCRLVDLLKEKDTSWKPRRSMLDSEHQEIYDFWLKDENSTQSVDRRSGRDKVRMSKELYNKLYSGIHDPNIGEETKTLKKTKDKIVVSALRKIYVKPVRELYQKFKNTSANSCSPSTFWKYKPFYVKPPSEREKISCMCMRCFNAQCLLKAINTYRKLSRLEQHNSVSKFLREDHNNDSHPEISATKVINYYIFESKEESYTKNGKEVKYTRTARVPKSEPVVDIVNALKASGEAYLRHRSHVENVTTVFPALRKAFTGTYIELDFSENISEKPKFEVQNAHFSGAQYSLHCSIIEPGEEKYVFHMSDDTTHDPEFVQAVLEDVFDKRGIRNDTVMIKSDNAPTQYKNKWAFGWLQYLANKYNTTIIRVYGAAGHGKGLIDAMSSFGVKGIVRQNIIGDDWWFNDSLDICNHLEARGNPHMSYTNLEPKSINEKREKKVELKIPGCSVMHLFVYEPNSSKVLKREYLCDCQCCLNFDFHSCEENDERNVKLPPQTIAAAEVDCMLDDDDVDREQQMFEFVEVPSFVALQSSDAFAPVYLVRVDEKGFADENDITKCGREFKKGEYFVKGRFLHIGRSRGNKNRHQFVIGSNKNDDEVAFPPDEIFETFLPIDENLTMDREEYKALIDRAKV